MVRKRKNKLSQILEQFSLKATKSYRNVNVVNSRTVGDYCLGLTGPLFRFSDTWQLVINTYT